MLFLSPSAPLSTLQKFTVRSAFIAYFASGLLCTAFPDIINFAFYSMKGTGSDIDYFRLNGIALSQIGFFYIVTGRSHAKVAGNGAILGTVPERLFFIPGALIWMYQQSMVPLLFATAFTALDASFALITYIIWYQNTPGASPLKCLNEIGDVMLPTFRPVRNWSSNCTQLIGYLQMAVSLAFAFKPEVARDLLGLEPFGEVSKGMIAVYFMSNIVIGWLQVLGAGNGSGSSPIAAVFYRLVWNVPLFAILFYFEGIERGFAVAVVVADSIGGLLIVLCLYKDSLQSKKMN